MASTRTNYGMGQYRYTRTFDYITKYLDTSTEVDRNKKKYCSINLDQTTSEVSSKQYQGILVKLPELGENKVPLVQYKKNYYMSITVPQDRTYEIVLDLKLMYLDNFNENDTIWIKDFQQIRRVIIPPTPDDDDLYSQVLLYEDLNNQVRAGIVNTTQIPIPSQVYKDSGDNGLARYRYYDEDGLWHTIVNHSNEASILQDWKMSENKDCTVTFDLVFSPKYILDSGYNYLLIDIVQSTTTAVNIQHVNDMGVTYYGVAMDINYVNVQLYTVNELINPVNSLKSQIVSGTEDLNHIAVWGHPELILAVNGEEIRIGQSGFYELKDFNISSLGVVVKNPEYDRFIIDYEYKTVVTTNSQEGE